MADKDNDITLRLRLEQVKQFLRDAKDGVKSIDDIVAAAKRASREVPKASSAVGGMSRSFLSLKQVVGGYWMYQAASSVGSLAAQTAKLGLSATAQLDTMLTGYTKILGSRGAARSLISDLQAFSDWSPFEDADVYKFAQQLLGAGAAAKQIVPSITAVGNAVAAFGGTSEDTLGAIVALRQIAANGVLQTQDLNQLAQHGINAKKYLAQAFHISGNELNKRLEARQIGSGQGISILLAGMEKEFGGTLKAQSQTIGGYWSTIKAGLMRSITADPDSPFAVQLRNWLAHLASDNVMKQVQARIRGALSRLWDLARAGKDFFDRLIRISRTPGAQRLFKDLGDGMHWAWSALQQMFAPLISVIRWLTTAKEGEVGNTLDKIAAFCENPVVQGVLKAFFVYAAYMRAYAAATKAAAAAQGLLALALGRTAKAEGAAAAAGGAGTAGKAAAGGALAGLGPAAWILGSEVYAGRQANPKFKQRTNDMFSDGWGGFGSGLLSMLTTPFSDAGSDIGGFFQSWFTHDGEGNKKLLSLLGMGGKPGAARGGTVTASGLVEVGEAGKELLALPRGAQVYPNRAANHAAAAMAGGGGCDGHDIVVDGDVIARVVHRAEDRQLARL